MDDLNIGRLELRVLANSERLSELQRQRDAARTPEERQHIKAEQLRTMYGGSLAGKLKENDGTDSR